MDLNWVSHPRHKSRIQLMGMLRGCGGVGVTKVKVFMNYIHRSIFSFYIIQHFCFDRTI